ncbi:polysaccharide biosynthesis tyrosine autokinase [Leptolyngbya sp. FACHB-261]|uniref:GumC family protein n=1 Tax=Leptolyngbya sp. FACHB-261 TaxID=2692806 RepID=UPI0016833C5C|nr:polysaccharide biosynthesis tyrosine autokinase [Leptolyngbya sp. FACHB-261]MBD2101750.1 polysaccharide biosynthesis tyrosine autokinase [Leptolyngbya sp. FACHB-261]
MNLGGNRAATLAEPSSVNIKQLFTILLRRRFWVLGTFSGIFLLATLLTMTARPKYQSSMQLLIQSNLYRDQQPGQREGSQFTDSTLQVDYTAQLNLLQSSKLIKRAVEILEPDYPDITVAEIKSSFVLTQLQSRLGTSIVPSQIFDATYIAEDPVKAEKVLHALQKVYLDYNLEQQNLRLVKGLSFINQQLPRVTVDVTRSERDLEEFRKRQGLIDPNQQSQILTASLSNIQEQRETIRAQYEGTFARYKSLQQQLNRSSQTALLSTRLSQSGLYQSLLGEIQKTDLLLAEQRLRFSDSHPTVQKLQNQRRSQIALLQQEASRVLGAEPTELNGMADRLLSEGRFGSTDQNLANGLIEAQTALSDLRARDLSFAQREQQIRSELSRLPSLLADYDRLQPEVQSKRKTLDKLLEAQQDLALQIAQGGFDWQVVEEPEIGAPIGRGPLLPLFAGTVIGLALGIAAALIRDMADDSIHSSDELKQLSSLPVLGMAPLATDLSANPLEKALPASRSQSLADSANNVVQWQPFREAIDLIYQNVELLGLNASSPLKSLVVTSALAGEGKSTIALGLAISATRTHRRVLLIDADLRRPSLHKLLNLPNEQGLSNLLISGSNAFPINNGIKPSGTHLDILTSGPTPVDPAKLLSSQCMTELMASLEEMYDLVILDAPPVLGMVDAILAAKCCKGTILVGRVGQVTRTELTQTITTLSKLNVIGIVANGANHFTKDLLEDNQSLVE